MKLSSFQCVPSPFDSTPKSNLNEFFSITSRGSFPQADYPNRHWAEPITGKCNDGSRNCPFSFVRNLNVSRSLRLCAMRSKRSRTEAASSHKQSRSTKPTFPESLWTYNRLYGPLTNFRQSWVRSSWSSYRQLGNFSSLGDFFLYRRYRYLTVNAIAARGVPNKTAQNKRAITIVSQPPCRSTSILKV